MLGRLELDLYFQFIKLELSLSQIILACNSFILNRVEHLLARKVLDEPNKRAPSGRGLFLWGTEPTFKASAARLDTLCLGS